MKVLLQFALRDPTDWEEIDATAWNSIPGRGAAVPTAQGGQNNVKRYLCDVNVQGVHFNGQDHIAVEPITIAGEEGVRVTCWNDDPADWPVGQRSAHVWTFLPLAPDPNLGGAINTRQFQMVYAEGERFARLDAALPQNTMLRPWSEFVPPTGDSVRHGIWLADAKFEQHRQMSRSFQNNRDEVGWRHWVDHLPDDEVETDGRGRVLKEQRKQGRWRRASHTKTYYQQDAAGDTGWLSLSPTNPNAFGTTADSSPSESATSNASAIFAYSFITPADEPNSSDWPSGVYHIQLDCTAASGGLTYGISATTDAGSGAFARVNAAGTTTSERLGTDGNTEFSGTGLKLHTSATLDFAAGLATDRFGSGVAVLGDSHGDAITLRFSSDAYADGPWSAGPQSVTPAAATLTLTTFAPTVRVNTILTPGVASLAFTTFAPSIILGTRLTPANATLALTTFAPTVSATAHVAVTPAPASLTFTTFAPTVTAGSIEPSATLDVVLKQGETTIATWNDVAVSGSIEDIPLTITAAEIANITFPATLTVEMTPTLEGGAGVRIYELDIALPALALTPAPASLTFTTFAPTVQVGTRLTPDPASLTFTTFAPTVITPVTLTPAAASISFTTFAPTVTVGTVITPSPASLVFTTFAPDVTVQLATSLDVALKQGAATIKTWTAVEVTDTIADIELELTEAEIDTISFPATLTVEVTGYINGSYSIRIYEVYLTLPTEVTGETLTPDPVSITFTTFAPTVAITEHKTLTPDPAALTLATFAPAVTVSDHKVVTPDPAAIVFTTFAPTVTGTTHYVATPEPATIVFTTFAPTILIEAVDMPGVAIASVFLLGFAMATVVVLYPEPRLRAALLGEARTSAAILPQISGMISPVGAAEAR